jgi:hypothetical protein
MLAAVLHSLPTLTQIVPNPEVANHGRQELEPVKEYQIKVRM